LLTGLPDGALGSPESPQGAECITHMLAEAGPCSELGSRAGGRVCAARVPQQHDSPQFIPHLHWCGAASMRRADENDSADASRAEISATARTAAKNKRHGSSIGMARLAGLTRSDLQEVRSARPGGAPEQIIL
jgi:hypothetical protein